MARAWRYSREKKRTEDEGTKNEKVEERKGWEERWAEKWEIRKKKKNDRRNPCGEDELRTRGDREKWGFVTRGGN